MGYNIEQQMRGDIPQVGYPPYRQVHAHSTGNPNSTAQNESDYMGRKDLNSGFYTHVVGNGRVIQVAPVNRGAWDVGGGYNYETYAAVELIESHRSRAEFNRDYKIYCELLHDLANEAGIPITLDTHSLSGIKTHNYCTSNQPYNASTHVDPIPYLTKWGITREQLANDIANSKGNHKPQPQREREIEMYLIYTVDAKNWYVSNGVQCRWIRSERMLRNYQNEFGKLNLPLDEMTSSELYVDFPKDKII